MSNVNLVDDTVYLKVDPNQTDGVDWKPNDPAATIVDNNYGTFTADDVVVSDTQIVVTTNSGTLTFSGPELDDAAKEFTAHEYNAAAQNLNEQAPDIQLMMSQMTDLILLANLELCKSERYERQSARDTAYNQAVSAAEKLMSGAVTNLVMGCISGSVGIIGGLVSGYQQFKGAIRLGRSFQDVRASNVKVKLANTQAELADTKVKISEANAELKALRAQPRNQANQQKTAAKMMEIHDLEQKATDLTTRRNELMTKLTDLTQTTQTKLDNAQQDHQAKQAEVDHLESQTPRNEKKIAAAKKELDQAWDECTELQGRLDRLKAAEEQLQPLKTIDPDGRRVATRIWTRARDEARAVGTQATAELKQSWDRFNMRVTNFQMLSNRYEGVRSLLTGVGGVFSTGGGFARDHAEKEKSIDDAKSQEASSFRDQHNSDYNRAEEQVQQGIQTFKSMVDMMYENPKSLWA
ncbi:MAG: hypothetical protein MI861_02540 [Pirellulales bacterium]|nr:hypothetical protein [Pirellulales bacterium]